MATTKRCYGWLAFLVAIVAILGGCAPLPDEPTPVPTATPARVDPSTSFVFMPYIDPLFEWVIPQSATVARVGEGRRTVFDYEDTTVIKGSYHQEVEVLPRENVESPEQLLLQRTAQAPQRSATRPVSIDQGRLTGAAISYDAGKGVNCPIRRATMVALQAGAYVYLLQIMADAPGRCDVDAVPETSNIIQSFRGK